MTVLTTDWRIKDVTAYITLASHCVHTSANSNYCIDAVIVQNDHCEDRKNIIEVITEDISTHQLFKKFNLDQSGLDLDPKFFCPGSGNEAYLFLKQN